MGRRAVELKLSAGVRWRSLAGCIREHAHSNGGIGRYRRGLSNRQEAEALGFAAGGHYLGQEGVARCRGDRQMPLAGSPSVGAVVSIRGSLRFALPASRWRRHIKALPLCRSRLHIYAPRHATRSTQRRQHIGHATRCARPRHALATPRHALATPHSKAVPEPFQSGGLSRPLPHPAPQ